MPTPRKKRVPATRRPKTRKAPDRVVELSIGAGDPLQPGGYAEYQSAAGKGAGGKPAPVASDARPADAQKADRGAALKAAQARWSSRHKGK